MFHGIRFSLVSKIFGQVLTDREVISTNIMLKSFHFRIMNIQRLPCYSVHRCSLAHNLVISSVRVFFVRRFVSCSLLEDQMSCRFVFYINSSHCRWIGFFVVNFLVAYRFQIWHLDSFCLLGRGSCFMNHLFPLLKSEFGFLSRNAGYFTYALFCFLGSNC
jgi:hypothetical protein